MGLFNTEFLKNLLGIKKKEEKETSIPIVDEKMTKPYKKLIHNSTNHTITIVTHEDELIFGNDDQIDLIRIASSMDEINRYLNFKPVEEEEQYKIKEEKQLVSDLLDILKSHNDFEVVGKKVYLKGISSVELPHEIVGAFIENLHKIEDSRQDNYYEHQKELERFQSLKYFTMWLLMNPIESSRNDCLSFMRKNQIPITSNGLMVCYRRVVSQGEKNKEFVKFISESYFKVKKNKKSPKNYDVFKDEEGKYVIVNTATHEADYDIHCGNLYELYNNLASFEENTYTDNHTRTKTIKVGDIYREDEDKIDLDNTKDCSNGLHVGGRNFGFNGFGDTGVIALVNPMKVRSVPVSDAHKMRVSEMFIAAIMEKEEYNNITEDEDIIDFSEIYSEQSLEELEKALAAKTFETISCQENLPAASLVDIKSIMEQLKQRIVTV